MKKLPRFCSLQYRTINVKTVSKEGLQILIDDFSRLDSARWAWAEHPQEDDTPPHFHLVACFKSPRRFSDSLEKLWKLDPHEYVKSCWNFRGSVRYLIHLDNPEKVQLPQSAINFGGDWDGVNKSNLLARSTSALDMDSLLRHISAYRSGIPQDVGLPRGNGGCFRPVQFAVWLESQGVDARKTFAAVRSMGLTWEELVLESEVVSWEVPDSQ